MNKEQFLTLLRERILILDGGMGTMIQTFGLTEQDYRGSQYKDWPTDLRGNNDLLSITRPDVIRSIHRQYLEAGADIFATNTFNANSISMEDYGMQQEVCKINLAAARLARGVADGFMQEHPDRTIIVAGSLGPTNKTASMSPDVNDPAYRAVTYRDLYEAYREQVDALIEGGVDVILFETTFDTLNVKAGLEAAEEVMHEKRVELPLMLSLTLSAQGGRTFSGQTLKAFLASIQHTSIVTIGLNCSFGAKDMLPHLEELAHTAPYYISAYPNAGLPNSFGGYDETPETMLEHVRPFVDEGLINILGGCCGTTPAHIAQFPALVKGKRPHQPVAKPDCLWLSGLELLEVKSENNFLNVGERCNVAGSRKFLRLIKEGNYEEALTIARHQVEDGAQVIDINMDDGMLDGVREMTTFLRLIASEPDIARVPVMIDSSKWEVIEQGLMCVQGKSIVNSISLKEGEAEFLRRAARIHQLGAAVVVMAFDETGQADTYERKITVCERAYRLLCDRLHYDPKDIIFDPNVLAIATGIEEHNGYGRDFIRATAWIKQNLPGSKVSGGVSNLSFSFRGNNYLREAMHAVFLYHAIHAGMDMGIVNPSASVQYEEIPVTLRVLLEDVILDRRPEAAEELIDYAQKMVQQKSTASSDVSKEERHTRPLTERLEEALVSGVGDYLEADLQEALSVYPRAVDIIDGPLMHGMNRVGELFGAGKMFLPQVVKTARTMKKAVAILQPAIEAEQAVAGAKVGKVLFATVKGDVHDIGKNIVSIVLTCNGYEVIDLGVMVPADVIVRRAKEEQPDFVCLSGLITPSLEEMAHVAEAMQQAGLDIPLMVGGATTSAIHTAVKIAPRYAGPVVHVSDASQNPLIAARLLNPVMRETYLEQLRTEQEALCRTVGCQSRKILSLDEARQKAFDREKHPYTPVAPCLKGIETLDDISLSELIPYINWRTFFHTWKMSGRFAELVDLHDCDACRSAWVSSLPAEQQAGAMEAIKLYKEAKVVLQQMSSDVSVCCQAKVGIFPASAEEGLLHVGPVTIPVLRQQVPGEDGYCRSLSDFVMADGDYVGAFAVTLHAESLRVAYEQSGDSYRALLVQTLADRLAEAASEWLHRRVRTTYWGYAADETLSVADCFRGKYQGIRPAVGYPSLPDQLEMQLLDQLLGIKDIGICLTEHGAMTPASSVSGLYIANPEAVYFSIGQLGEEQLVAYGQNRSLPLDTIRSILSKQC